MNLAQEHGVTSQTIRRDLQELEARITQGFAHELPVPFYHQKRGRFVREEL